MTIGLYINNTQSRAKYIINLIFSTSGISYTPINQLTNIPKVDVAILCNYSDQIINTLTNKGIHCVLLPSKIDDINNNKTNNYIGWISNKILEDIPVFSQKDVQILYGNVLFFWKNSTLPAITLTKKNSGSIVNFGFDILSSIFFLCIDTESISNQKPDKHLRSQARTSFHYKNHLLSKPLLNIYIKVFISIFHNLTNVKKNVILQKWYWPNNMEYAACLTHDIDVVKKWSPGKIKDELINHIFIPIVHNSNKISTLKRFINVMVSMFRLENCYWNFDKIMNIEDTYNFKSSFFLSTEKDISNGLEYDVTNKKIVKMLKKIIKKGWEIGLHGSYYSYNNNKKLQSEKSKLENLIETEVIGIRQHILRFETPSTWLEQQSAGLLYDCTYGYADYEGFRAGIGFPFFPYNAHKNENIGILEIPLTVMDGTLGNYRKLKAENAKLVVFDLIENIRTYNGIGCFLWHNKYFDDLDYPGYGQLYNDVLKLLHNDNAFVSSGKEVYKWWISRAAVVLEKEILTDSHCEWTFKNNGDKIDGLTFKIHYSFTNNIPSINIVPDLNIKTFITDKNEIITIISSVPQHHTFKIKLEY